METVECQCYNCGSGASAPYDSENGWTLVKCHFCGLVYLNPRPGDDLISQSSITGEHHGEALIDTTGSFDSSKIERYQRILADFFPDPIPNQSRWLDIGCGFGEFLVALNQFAGNRIRTTGSEPNRQKSAFARSQGLDVDFYDLSEFEGKFDYLSLLNVYSHLPDPPVILQEWARTLVPGGYLFLETGHSCHLAPVDHHKPYYLPDHLSFANQSIVEDILRKLGFKIIKTRLYRHTVFPELSVKRVIREGAKFLLRRPNRLSALFPKAPKRDMYILAQKSAATHRDSEKLRETERF